MNNEYLPSKQFLIRVGALVAILVIIVGVYELVHFIRNRSVADASAQAQTNLVIKSIVQKDSNNNGIADWEETLWGLDPTKNGDSNKAFILAKRQAIASDTTASTDIIPGQSTPENQALSQDFFAAIVSLQQTGNLDEVSLKAITDAIGDKITATDIPDIYTENMAKTVETTELSRINYLTDYANLITKYKSANMGYELSLMSVALENNDPGALVQVRKVAKSYQDFGKDLMNLQVPTSIAPSQVSLANNYQKVGQSLSQLTQVFTDPITAMKGMVNYNKYSQALFGDVNTLTDKIGEQ